MSGDPIIDWLKRNGQWNKHSGTALGAIVVDAKRQPDGSVFLFKLGGGVEILPKPRDSDA